jgi:AraC family transcriptional regulator
MNLTQFYEIVTRSQAHYVFVEKYGPFAEVAPPTWNDLFSLIREIDPSQITGYIGLSTIDKTKTGEEAMIYEAGLTLASLPTDLPKGLKAKKIGAGKYARFMLTGPYSHVWPAFNQIFRTLADEKKQLRPDFCIENYLNDPKVTPEDKLLTELLVPIV